LETGFAIGDRREHRARVLEVRIHSPPGKSQRTSSPSNRRRSQMTSSRHARRAPTRSPQAVAMLESPIAWGREPHAPARRPGPPGTPRTRGRADKHWPPAPGRAVRCRSRSAGPARRTPPPRSRCRARGCRCRIAHRRLDLWFNRAHRWLAATLGQLGRIDEAGEALEEAVTIAPPMFDLYVRQRPPWFRPEDHTHMLEGLRTAGWKS
jgi:hypothetical protein